MPEPISRRTFVVGTAALATVVGAKSFATPEVGLQSSARLVPVPNALPDRVYGTEAAGISRRTHDAHLRLWQGYANKTNEIRTRLAEMNIDPTRANQIYSDMRGLKVNYAFAYGGYINHKVYFEALGAPSGDPKGPVEALISESFGSLERFYAEWKATGLAGRGWAYLAYDLAEERAFIHIGDSQDTFPVWNQALLLAMDVYEHAYVLDFGIARARYIDACLRCVDWSVVDARLARARALLP